MLQMYSSLSTYSVYVKYLTDGEFSHKVTKIAIHTVGWVLNGRPGKDGCLTVGFSTRL